MVGLFVFLFYVPTGVASEINTTTGSNFQSVIYLHDLEPKINNDPDILLAVAELEESVGHLDQVEAESGLQAFIGSEAGRFRESLGYDYFREYNQINLKAGLRHPLLGSSIAEQKQILQSKYDIKEKEEKHAILLRENLLLLRKQYIAYWTAQEKQSVINAFLDDEHTLTEALSHRKEAGLLLEADRLKFMAALASVRSIAQKQLGIQQRALGLLKYITGQTIEPFKAVFPQMKSPCTDAGKMAAIIRAENPRLVFLKKKLEEQQELVRLTDKSSPEGKIELVGSLSTDAPNSSPGYSVYLNVQFDFPWKARKANSAKRKIVRSVYDQLEQEVVITESSLMMDSNDALQAYKTAQDNIDFMRRQLSAAQERVRENLLRLAYLPGDVIEKVQQSRTEALKAALNLIDAQAQKLTQQAVLLSYTESKTPPDQTRKEEKKEGESTLRDYPEKLWKDAVKTLTKPGTFHGLTFYVWDTQNLPFDSNNSGQWFDNIARLGVKRLLLSFTPQQIASMQNRDQRKLTAQFIRHAGEHGIRVEWLLGDPSWILPEHRDALIELVRSFSDIPFQGIHLDLEPDQLSIADHDSHWLLDQLCKTVNAVKSSTTLPVGLSMHYRYFQDSSTGTFLASAFDKMELNEITLMIFISDTKRVNEIAGSILEHYPKLIFSIAQSIEPILTPAESYNKMSKKDFLLKLAKLSGQLQYQNFGSLVIQDWQSFLEMAP